MILHNLFYNRQPDAASTLTGISRCIRAIKTVENIWQILHRNSLSIVLNINFHKISCILDANIDDTTPLIHIFNRISDNIIHHSLKLFHISDNNDILLQIIKVGQLYILLLQIQ